MNKFNINNLKLNINSNNFYCFKNYYLIFYIKLNFDGTTKTFRKNINNI